MELSRRIPSERNGARFAPRTSVAFGPRKKRSGRGAEWGVCIWEIVAKRGRPACPRLCPRLDRRSCDMAVFELWRGSGQSLFQPRAPSPTRARVGGGDRAIATDERNAERPRGRGSLRPPPEALPWDPAVHIGDLSLQFRVPSAAHPRRKCHAYRDRASLRVDNVHASATAGGPRFECDRASCAFSSGRCAATTTVSEPRQFEWPPI